MNGNPLRRNCETAASLLPPSKWLRCPQKSTGFIAGKFLVFKTPLSNRYDKHVSAEYRFYPQMVNEYKLGLWIDLTNTDRFYPREQIEAEGIQYVKCMTPGHGKTPRVEQVKLFNRICQQFMKLHPDGIIAVHCTHGFNKSGYLICAFLISVWEWEVQAALNHFAQLRPPGIYKQHYINQLCHSFGLPEDGVVPVAPALPDWYYENDDECKDSSSASSSTTGLSFPNVRLVEDAQECQDQPTSNRKREIFKANPTFMKGVPGVFPITDRNHLSLLQQKVQDMCGWKGTGFPGCHPVSIDKNNLKLLAEKPYMVSWKADGTRYLMLIDGPEKVYLIDRDNCIFHAPFVTFFRKNEKLCEEPEPEHLVETLVDGEMVLDKVNDATLPRYLIYDIIKFRGEEVGNKDLRHRLSCIRDELIGPRNLAIRRGLIYKAIEPFGIRFKTFWYLNETENILKGKFARQLLHQADGLIFQPCRDAYKVGLCDNVLKWKPPHLNTIDFRLKIVQKSGEGLYRIQVGELYVESLDEPFDQMEVTSAVSQLHGKIVECKYDKNKWVFLRERTDKSFPNELSTAKEICEIISQPVTQEFLLGFIAQHNYLKS